MLDKIKNIDDFEINLSGEEVETTEAKEKRSWFKRKNKNIVTTTAEKRDVPGGLWVKCPSCKYTCTVMELKESLYVCPQCNYHHRIGSEEYFDILYDDKKYIELFTNIKSKDFLGFTDLKPYKTRLDETYAKTGLNDSISVAVGKIHGNDLITACMDFEFIGGSIGSVMGEKIARSVDYSLEHKVPFMIINKSGGARMMESAFSLMQLAKTSGKLSQLSDAKIPYISLCTDPTFGGTTASFAMLGDIIIAEPAALIGFAGPRVIKETIKKDLPKGFQKSEFVLEHGFLDFIVNRKELRDQLGKVLDLFKS